MSIITKASYKNCAIEDRKRFNISSCILPISIGQPIHEGKKFEATLNLVNSTFKKATILIDDSIQRFTMKISSPIDELSQLRSKAIRLGKEWLERNSTIINSLEIENNVIHWDFWIENPNYPEFNKIVLDYYSSSATYKNAIHENINVFLSRFNAKNKQLSKIELDEAFKLCLDYLLEECSSMMLWASSGYDFEIYPYGRNLAMQATFELIIKKMFPNKLKSVSLRFKKHHLKQIIS